MLSNKGAERAVLAGLCQHGFDCYIEVVDILSIDCFLDPKNQLLFRVIENIFSKDQRTIDVPSINSEAQSYGVYDRICKDQIDQEYIRSLFNYPIDFPNVRHQSQVLVKLKIGRRAQEAHQKAFQQLEAIKGDEGIDQIVKISEAPFMELMSTMTNESSVDKIGEDIDEYLEHLETNSDKSVGIYTPFPIFNDIVGDGLRPGVHLVAARAKVGKMQPYDSLIYTPTGPKKMGEIETGDVVLTPFNEVAFVTDIFEHGLQDVYKVSFIDGTSMECGLDHIFEYTTRKSKYFRNKTLRELLEHPIIGPDRHYLYRVRISKPIQFNETQQVIDPYIMGVILSDKEAFKNFNKKDMLLFYDIEKWKDRRIPHEYLYGTLKSREALYKGMMDGSGIISNKVKEYSSDSVEICKDLCELVRTMGGVAENFTYRVEVRFDVVTKSLISVEKLDTQKVSRCIKIDKKHGLYLTDDLIVTHNSTVGKEVSVYTAKQGVPTLYLDTEMQSSDQINRILASMTKINIRRIEKGLYKDNPYELKRVRQAAAEVKNMPLFHKNVSGKDFAYVLSILKRWIHKEVGFNGDKPNPHMVVYDYFKLMDPKSLKDAQEYQLMGFQIAAMHDFCMQNNTPVLSFVQTNRDGITKDSADVVSQSDRLVWNCISLSILRRKTSDEIAVDGIQNGNAKLIPLAGRYMKILDDGDYLNFNINGDIANIKEISTRRNPKTDTGFEIDNSSKQDIESGNGSDPDKIGDIEL